MKHLLLLAAVATAACNPTCQQVCNKLDRCGFDDAVQVNVCQATCERQLLFVQELDDEDAALKQFNDHRRCIGNTSCDDLAAGQCVDDELFAVDE